MTLKELVTTTTVQTADSDEFVLNGEKISDIKLQGWLKRLRAIHPIPPIHIESSSNFPINAGLASSASGYAALVTALRRLFALDLSPSEMALITRSGSVSAARSLLGGYVALDPDHAECIPIQLHPSDHWDLRVVIAVVDSQNKIVSSTEAMSRTVASSDFYSGWLRSARRDFEHCVYALRTRNFEELSQVAELSCSKLHALMLTSVPSLMYWNASTLAAIDAIKRMQREGVPVFFTSDAGPQLKAICRQEAVEFVEETLSAVEGVLQTMVSAVGDEPSILEHD